MTTISSIQIKDVFLEEDVKALGELTTKIAQQILVRAPHMNVALANPIAMDIIRGYLGGMLETASTHSGLDISEAGNLVMMKVKTRH